MDVDDLDEDDTVGPWRLEKQLGKGGQARVWKARHRDERHSPPAAIKFCAHGDSKAHRRFAQEIDLLRTYKHSNVVALRDEGFLDDMPYFVMEFASATLDRLSATDSTGIRLLQENPALLIEFFRQACAGVAHLHANDVLHRDIKPSNILLFLDIPDPLRAAVSDLGIGSAADDQGSITSTHETVGTPIYRAPEALYGKHTKASDVYSLGKTLEFIFTRKVPSSMGPGMCMRDARTADGLWDALDSILLRACAEKPKERYPDAAALMADLPLTVLTSGSSTTAPTSVPLGKSLASSEIRVLADVIGATLSKNSRLDLLELQNRSVLSNFSFSMGLHGLRMAGFVETFDARDEQGDYFEAVRATETGRQWAYENRDAVARELNPPRNSETF